MKPNFIMMCGLPGSGKTELAKELEKGFLMKRFSSDELRLELYGDENDQTHNEEVFKELHRRIKECLKSGQGAIYDACNISYKRRKAFIDELKHIDCHKINVFMATKYETCVFRNNNRKRKVPEKVIQRMYYNFDVPWYYEGWDEIIPFIEAQDDICFEWIDKMMNYNQDNYHHSLSLGEHCIGTSHIVKDTSLSEDVMRAALLHDCGKPRTKTFVNTKGEESDVAHYYFHEHVGSYDSLFYKYHGNPLYVAVLIRWHMQPYFWEKDNNIKQQLKYKKLWGEALYNEIMLIHEADKKAH